MKTRRPYATDLSDEEWTILEPLLPRAKPGGRPPAHHTREELLEAIFYVVRGGCAWRLLPHDFPPSPDGLPLLQDLAPRRQLGEDPRCYFAGANPSLREGRQEAPSAAIVDTQSVRTTEKGGYAATTEPRR